ncbi:unnamed protein product [Sphagnum compactum]
MSGTASASAAQTDACSGLSQLNSGAQEQCGGGNGTSTVSALVKTIITILSFIVGAASVIVIIISGLRYITSGGESSKVSGAKSGLVYALIGIAIAKIKKLIQSTLLLGLTFGLVAPFAFNGAAAAAATGTGCNNSIASSVGSGLASTTSTGGTNTCATTGSVTSGVGAIAKTVVNIFSVVVGVISVIMIIYAGFRYITSGGESGRVANSGKRYVSGLRYITSGGESSKVSGAKSGLVYALIGIAIAKIKKLIQSTLLLGLTFGLVAPFAFNGAAAACNGTIGSQIGLGIKDTGSGGQSSCGSNGSVTSGVGAIAKTVVNIFSVVVGVISVIMIIYAGFRYITSGGESGRVGNAKNTLVYAIIGLVIVVLAQVIVHYVLSTANTAAAPAAAPAT